MSIATKKTQAHQRYRNKDGDIVPGVTTVINEVLAKPALIKWANNLGLQGIDSSKYRDERGSIGSLTHEMIMCELSGRELDTSDYSWEQIDKAENSYLKWLEWSKGKKFEPLLVEQQLVSDEFQYGGCPDYHGMIDNIMTLTDYKTGYVGKECYIQTCAYYHLLIENGYQSPERIIVLSLPRDETEKFQEIIYTSFDIGWEIFKSLKNVYELLKRC